MLDLVCQAAREQALCPTVLTFSPHPRQYFAGVNHRPELSPPQITGLRDKVTELTAAGIQRIMVARFNRAMAEMSAPDFVTQLLGRALNTRWLLVGEDFRFGRQRGGDIDLLRRLGRQHGMHVKVRQESPGPAAIKTGAAFAVAIDAQAPPVSKGIAQTKGAGVGCAIGVIAGAMQQHALRMSDSDCQGKQHSNDWLHESPFQARTQRLILMTPCALAVQDLNASA